MNKLTLRARLWILALVPVLGVIGTSVFSMYSANSVYSDLLERIHKEAFVAQSLVINGDRDLPTSPGLKREALQTQDCASLVGTTQPLFSIL